MPRTLIGKFRLIGFVEGLSYLLLLGVAMPLKYYFGEVWEDESGEKIYEHGIYVTVVGMTHGVLFILYCLQLFLTMRHHKWSFGYAFYLLFMAFIPFGTFYTDRRLCQLVREN
jgi:integral membrane protein